MLKSVMSVGVVAAVIAAGLFTPLDPSGWKLFGYSGAGSEENDTRVGSWETTPDSRARGATSFAQPTVDPDHRMSSEGGRPAILAFPRVAARSEAAGGTNAHTSPRPTALTVPRVTPAMPRIVSNQVVTQTIVRSLQSELRRVGCYSGRIDGDWGPASRFAMATFVSRVNAALPTDKPGHVLLSLVQRHATSACGADYVASLPIRGAAKIHVRTSDGRASNWRARVTLASPATTRPLATYAGTRQPATMEPNLIRRPRVARSPVVLRSTPRIVRSHNLAVAANTVNIAATNSTAALAQINATAPSVSQQPYSYGAPPMALGAPAPSAQDATATGQAAPIARPSYKPSRRKYRSSSRRKSSRRYRSSRRADRSWRRRATSSLNLNGS